MLSPAATSALSGRNRGAGAGGHAPEPAAFPANSAAPVHAPSAPPTLNEALRDTAGRLESGGIDSPAREARILLRHALDCSEEALAGGRVTGLTSKQVLMLHECVTRRLRGEPIAYIVGKKEFFGREFAVDRRVLIPRPETELLVEHALAYFGCTAFGAPACPPDSGDVRSRTVADVGTGSGAIAVSIAKHLPRATVYATDVSAGALAVARANAAAHGVADTMVFSTGRYLEALPQPVQLIVCNPPYIPCGDIPGLDPDVRDYEPRLALAGGADGVAAYREIFPALPRYLLPGGCALFEMGFDMAARLTALAARHLPQARVDVYRDLAGYDRILRIICEKP